VPERLIDRELAEAKRSLENLRVSIKQAPGVRGIQKFADLLFGGSKSKSPGELAAPYLADIENIYAQLTAKTPQPTDFKAIEEAIDIINQNVLEDIAEMAKYTAMKQELLGSSPTVAALLQLQAFGNPIGFENLESLREEFSALKIYKLVLESEALQRRRDEMLPDFLRQAQKWDGIACKIEIRKRRDQLAKVEVDPLPKVNLITTSDVALPQIFASQQRFLSDLISDLEEIRQGTNGKPAGGRSRKDEINTMIRDCEQEIKELEKDPKMDEGSKRRRQNILSKKRDSLYEELESLY
jgi:hypothetical protein